MTRKLATNKNWKRHFGHLFQFSHS